jgi:hypothetical protein
MRRTYCQYLILSLLLRSAMMRTVVFLAARPLSSDSELLVDYRLAGTPRHPLPPWYPREGRHGETGIGSGGPDSNSNSGSSAGTRGSGSASDGDDSKPSRVHV